MTKPIRRPGSAVYYARRVVPKELRGVIPKREIWKSLGTRELEDAKRLNRVAQVAFDELFAEARGRIGSPSPASPGNHNRFHSQEEEEEDYAQQEALDYAYEERQALLDADPLLRAKADLAASIREELWNRQVAAEVRADEAAERAVQKLKGPTLSAVIQLWETAKRPEPKTVDRMKAVVAWFEEYQGRLPVALITVDDVLAFRDKLLTRTSPANARTKLRNLNTLLRFAVERRAIKSNPAHDIGVTIKVVAGERRREFDAGALAKLFSSRVYSEGVRPAAGGGEAAYWLPLLGLYTGARLNELGQLRSSDVHQEAYVDAGGDELGAWVIKIQADPNDGLKLKNAGSERRVPIHADLISLGFLTYVHAQADSPRLFPLLKPDKYGTVTASWSKWFNRYLRDPVGITDTHVVFHSFRHSFKHYARQSGIAKEVHDAITGHAGKDAGDDYGGMSFPLAPLVDAIARYKIAGFKLPPKPPGSQAVE